MIVTVDKGVSTGMVEVLNVAPTITKTLLTTSSVEEGTEFAMTVGWDDPAGSGELFKVTVDWGDGTVEVVEGVTGRARTFFHTYEDDGLSTDPRDIYTIKVQVQDDDEGPPATKDVLVVVTNKDPTLAIVAEPSVVGATVSFSAQVLDTSPLDELKLRVDWGDGNTSTILAVRTGGSITLDSHTYTGTPGSTSTYTVKISALDDDGGSTPVQLRQVTVTIPMTQLGEQTGTTSSSAVTEADLASLFEAAQTLWLNAGLSYSQLSRFDSVQLALTDLPSNTLGIAELAAGSMVIRIDADAAGRGWFIDSTPMSSKSSRQAVSMARRTLLAARTRRVATTCSPVLMHEMGHVLGLDDEFTTTGELMNVMLPIGMRRAPSAAEVTEANLGNAAHEEAHARRTATSMSAHSLPVSTTAASTSSTAPPASDGTQSAAPVFRMAPWY